MADERTDWAELRQRRMSAPGAVEAHDAARLAFELGAVKGQDEVLSGAAVRSLREEHGWSQTQLAQAAGMTQSAVARLEAGGTVPTLPVLERLLERLARALDVELAVRSTPKTTAA